MCAIIQKILSQMYGFVKKKTSSVQMGRQGTMACKSVLVLGGGYPEGVDSDRLAWENCDADPLIKIDVLPFCFKCN